jgi:hypothetical protein
MTAITWKALVSGNWTVAADWSTGAVPNLSDDVTIAAPFSYTITVSSNGVIVHPIGGLQADAIPFGVPDEANSLTFDAQEATFRKTRARWTLRRRSPSVAAWCRSMRRTRSAALR